MKLPIKLFILFLLMSCGQKSAEIENAIRRVKYAKVESNTGMETYSFSGVAKAQNEIQLSFKVAGTLASVNVKLGDRVRKGQIIATIDPADYIIQTNQAVSQKEGAIANSKATQSQLIKAKATYDRVAQLYENSSVSLSEYQQAKAALDAAQAQHDAAISQVDAASSQLKAADNQVSYTNLISPLDGVITAMEVEANEVINAGALIAKVSSLGRPKVEVGVSEVAINKFKIDKKANIHFPSLPNRIFEAKVTEIGFASEKSTTYAVILEIINYSDEIRPGMAAEVNFTIDADEGQTKSEIVAPLKAIASAADGNYAFKLVPDTEKGIFLAKRVILDLGAITENGYIIKNGLKQGDLVAVAGLRSLYEGKKVMLLENNPK